MIVNEETPAERCNESVCEHYDPVARWGHLCVVANTYLSFHPFNMPLELGWRSRCTV